MKNILVKLLILVMALFLLDGCAARQAKREEKQEARQARQEERQARKEQRTEQAEPTEVAEGAVETADGAVEAAEATEVPPEVPSAEPQATTPGSSQDYVLNELNFEIKKLAADLSSLTSELRDLQARSTMWANPLAIYSKEIILENGTTIYGKIVYQDEQVLRIETLIGYIQVERSSVVRIVENIPEEPLLSSTETESVSSTPTTTATPANRVVEPTVATTTSTTPTARASESAYAPNVVLVGTIQESKDRSGNLILKGEVKNIGGRRADFVKVNFVFRQDWSGNTEALTTFVQGSFFTFESGITSDSSLLPGATGTFEQYIPQNLSSAIGYSYTIDWEDFQ